MRRTFMISFRAERAHEKKTLYDLLSEKYAASSEKVLISAFKKCLITLNGQDACADDEVHGGDEVSIYLTRDALGEKLYPKIIYQDENIVIADKPAGLACADENGQPSAVSLIEEMMKQRGEYNLQVLMVPYMVYPLEKYVSGLMILAKHEEAYLFLSQALAQRRISRFFICAVAGDASEADELLAYHRHDKQKSTVQILGSQSKVAKPIVTRYYRLSQGTGLSLICARPITNYLHQVRAHLAFEGLPVIGDSIYGDRKLNRRYNAEHIALWLNCVVFETGSNHEYSYLNGKRFESLDHSFPKCVFDAGLLDYE